MIVGIVGAADKAAPLRNVVGHCHGDIARKSAGSQTVTKISTIAKVCAVVSKIVGDSKTGIPSVVVTITEHTHDPPHLRELSRITRYAPTLRLVPVDHGPANLRKIRAKAEKSHPKNEPS